MMSSRGHASEAWSVAAGSLGGVDLTHGLEAILHLLVDIVLPPGS